MYIYFFSLSHLISLKAPPTGLTTGHDSGLRFRFQFHVNPIQDLSPVSVGCLSVCQPSEWAAKLDALVTLSSKRVEERKKELLRKAAAGPQAQADVHRQIRLWSLRLQLYCRMKENFQNTGQWSWVSWRGPF